MSASEVETWLREFATRHVAVAGTVHKLNGDALELAAALNMPPKSSN